MPARRLHMQTGSLVGRCRVYERCLFVHTPLPFCSLVRWGRARILEPCWLTLTLRVPPPPPPLLAHTLHLPRVSTYSVRAGMDGFTVLHKGGAVLWKKELNPIKVSARE